MIHTTFYKYRTDTEYTEQILTSGKVFLSTADGLNDPFECSLQEIGKEWIKKQVSEMQQAGVSGFMMDAMRAIQTNQSFFGQSWEETIQMLEEIKQLKDIAEKSAYRNEIMKKLTGHPPSNSERLFSQLDAQLLSVGIFSMSANPEQELMWAHYGGQHSGVCLGFENTNGFRLSDPEHFLPVIYSSELPEMAEEGFINEMSFSIDNNGLPYTSSFKIAFSDKTFQKAMTTKSPGWRYEEEWRYVEPYPGLFTWPGRLTEMTFGLKCKENRIEHYIKLIEEHVPYSVHFYQMRKKRGTNQLERCPWEKSISSPKPGAQPMQEVDQDTGTMSIQDFVAKMEKFFGEGRIGDVLFEVDKNLEKYPDDPNLLQLKGRAHGYAQEPGKALECFTKLTDKYPGAPIGWYQAACALTDLKRYNEAVEAFKKADELDPNDPSTAFNLGDLLRLQGHLDEALVYLKRADRLGHRRAYSVIEEIGKIK